MARSSVTTTDPIWRRSINEVASVSEASAPQVTDGDDIRSSTAVVMRSLLGSSGPWPPVVASSSCSMTASAGAL